MTPATTVLVCSWKSPAMLDTHLRSLIASLPSAGLVKVVLNEGLSCKESVDVCFKHGVEFVVLGYNSGTLGVDFAASMVQTPYVTISNDDFLFHPGWMEDIINLIEQYYPASASCSLVEPFFSNNPVVLPFDFGDTLDKAYEPFMDSWRAGALKLRRQISYTHPITVRTEDYFRVGAYADNFDWSWKPGYGLDDWFPMRLWAAHDRKFRFIASEKSFVYHLASATNKKLSPELKARSGREYFQKKAGMTIEDFRRAINIFSDVT